ncbi:methyltransferase domain-containing protein [Polyangium sp. y55x31]|uniref:SAM-dependent methyltransferase n=1 Tax=Polyangium sp. y55x31 TaxID=3042688 RepID=UPI0024824CE9|nr:methyltransferase domain-containing protein [Polyangium sp. y55x31]MDI1480853.1 methyltransferase domain-containing protein [Polyangium sp. y55x31]
MTAPAPDRLKFTTIAHATHRYLSPLSPEKATRLLDGLALRESAEVLDIGCGRAGFLLDLVERSPVSGLGVDLNAAFIASARAEATRRGVEARVRLVDRPLVEVVGEAARFDAIVCMGSSQAIGTFAEALRWAHAHLVPGGVALFADGFWRRRPDPGYLEALGGATEDEMNTHAGNTRVAREAGFCVLSTACASDDEWDAYEGRYCAAIERYVDANPADPDVPAMAARIRAWHDAYVTWGRDTLGYGFYTLLKPTSREP